MTVAAGPIAYLDIETFDGRSIRRLDTPIGFQPGRSRPLPVIMLSPRSPAFTIPRNVGRILETWRTPVITGGVVIFARVDIDDDRWAEVSAGGLRPVRAALQMGDIGTHEAAEGHLILSGSLAAVVLVTSPAFWPGDTVLIPERTTDAPA